jgi:2,5-diketo-D-gluconate reductase A
MRENIEVFDFELTDDEMARIAALDRGRSLFFDHHDPALVESFAERRLG